MLAFRSLRLVVATAVLATLALVSPTHAWAKIRVVASITDLGSIASAVGGDQVDVAAIARPSADVHHVEVLPSYMVRVSRAKLYLKVGLSLDQWADQIIDGSRNSKLTVLDCSAHVAPLEVPTTRVDARQGDVHPNGNPHYWLDPRNGGVVARDIAEALAALDPAHAADFRARAGTFAKACDTAVAAAAAQVAAMSEHTLITYHASWIYFGDALGLTIPEHVEPVPGIPPTGGHLQDLVNLIKQQHIPVLLQEPYYSDDAPKFLARQTGIKVVKVSPSCDDTSAPSYLAHFGALVDAITTS